VKKGTREKTIQEFIATRKRKMSALELESRKKEKVDKEESAT